VKELVLTGLLLASRDVLGGINYVRSLSAVTDEAELNKLVEAEKKRFKGRELVGKTSWRSGFRRDRFYGRSSRPRPGYERSGL
jgi:hypothetical protein